MINLNNISHCLICCSNKEDANILSSLFLQKGCAFTINNSPNDIIDLLKKKQNFRNKFKIIVIGLDFADNKGYELLDFVNKIYFNDNYPDKELPLIITISMFLNQTKIQELQSKHVVHFFIRPININLVKHDLSSLFFKYRNILPNQSAIRIETQEEELMRGNCKYYDGRHISVKIVDVSISGVHILCYDDVLLQDIQTEEHDFLEHFIFEADNSIIDTDARILFTSDEDIFLEFTHFYGDSLKYLIDYLKTRMV